MRWNKIDILLQFNNFLIKNTVSKQNDYYYTLRNRSSTGCFCSDATEEQLPQDVPFVFIMFFFSVSE